MSLYRRAPRRDGNEKAIQQYLEAAGASWLSLSVCGGPDAIVGDGRKLALVEVKQVRTGRYTAQQRAWREHWRGPQPVELRTEQDAQKLLRMLRYGC